MNIIEKVHIKDHKIIKGIELKNLKKNNIFFGWNGTGKSTFSNIFYEISTNGDCSEEYKKYFTTHNNDIKVFNKKYIVDNLSDFLNGDHKKDKIILGEENKENQKKLDKIKQAKKNLKDNLERIEKEIKEIEGDLDKEKIEIAKRARVSLSKNDHKGSRAINKNSIKYPEDFNLLKSYFNKLKNLDNEKLSKNIKIFQQQEKDKLEKLKITDFGENFQEEEKKLQELFSQTPLNGVIKELESYKELNFWAEQGLKLHIDGNTCKFCGNKLTEQRKQELNNHFNDKYKKLQNDLKQKKEAYKTKINNIEEFKNNIYSKEKFYIELQDEFKKEHKNLSESMRDLQKYYEKKIKLIDEKNKNPFKPLQINDHIVDKINDHIVDKIDDHIFDEKDYLNDFNSLIEQNNKYAKDLEEEKEKAMNLIIEHYTKDKESFVIENRKRKNKLNKNIDKIKVLIKKREKKIISLEKKFTNTEEFANKITNDLHKYLGREELEIKNVDGGYKILRNGGFAEGLSEGERSAIAFAYFILSLQDKKCNLSNTIVVIDDPITSMDENFIYASFQYIADNTKSAGQRFIFTHSIKFLRLLHKEFEEENSEFYIMETKGKKDERQASIKTLSKKQRESFSLYFTLFKYVYDSKNNNDNNNIAIANMCRQLLESFHSFKNPNNKNLRFSLEEYEYKEAILRYVNSESHNNIIPDESENSASQNDDNNNNIAKLILEHIEKTDKDHYDGMIEKIKEQEESTNDNNPPNEQQGKSA